jgi:DNA-binding GntR family transcriptional regulator
MAMLDRLEPVRRESTASIIADQLRAAIMDGLMPPGTQMGESELASRLGVSRGPLREAMQRLVQEGLLRSERHRGLFVTSLEPDDIHDLYVARTAVERAAAMLVLRGTPQKTAARLGEVHAQMVEAARGGELEVLADADLRFHDLFIAESGSPRLQRMAGSLLVETRICMRALKGKYAVPADLAAEHGLIIERIRDGDVDALLAVVEEHMKDAEYRLAST